MKVAIVGGTGPFGRALAARLAALGEDEVVIGSRDAERARATAEEFAGCTGLDQRGRGARSRSCGARGRRGGRARLRASRSPAALGDTPLFSVASVLGFSKDGVRPDPDALSLAERIQQVVGAPVVAGLHSIAASNLAAERPDEDAFVCGDDAAAKALALDLAGKLVAGRALDAGPLAGARTLEGMTAVIVNLNRRYKAHAGIRISGVS